MTNYFLSSWADSEREQDGSFSGALQIVICLDGDHFINDIFLSVSYPCNNNYIASMIFPHPELFPIIRTPTIIFYHTFLSHPPIVYSCFYIFFSLPEKPFVTTPTNLINILVPIQQLPKYQKQKYKKNKKSSQYIIKIQNKYQNKKKQKKRENQPHHSSTDHQRI